jgi:hypothetical protein
MENNKLVNHQFLVEKVFLALDLLSNTLIQGKLASRSCEEELAPTKQSPPFVQLLDFRPNFPTDSQFSPII